MYSEILNPLGDLNEGSELIILTWRFKYSILEKCVHACYRQVLFMISFTLLDMRDSTYSLAVTM